MGRFLNGINGPIVGKVGTVHGSSWNGVPYVKGPYKKRTKRISKKEKANREKFGMAQSWLHPLLDFVRQGFKGYHERFQGFVAAKSWLLKNAFEGGQINPALVKLSAGSLPLPESTSVAQLSKGKLKFTWSTECNKEASRFDQVMMLAYDIQTGEAIYQLTGQFRSAGTDDLPITTKPGRVYQLYIAFVAADRQAQSDSKYLGEWKT